MQTTKGVANLAAQKQYFTLLLLRFRTLFGNANDTEFSWELQRIIKPAG
jgi:hypothetical protein